MEPYDSKQSQRAARTNRGHRFYLCRRFRSHDTGDLTGGQKSRRLFTITGLERFKNGETGAENRWRPTVCLVGFFPHGESEKPFVYRVQEHAATYYGQEVRLIVVESSTLDKKKRHTLEKKKEQEFKQLQIQQKSFEDRVFHCEEDAKEALDKWLQKKKWQYHQVHPKMERRQTLKRKRGRPKKEEVPEETVTFHIQLVVTLDEAIYEEACRKASRFVLVTTIPDDYQGNEIDAQEVLRLYKGQAHVEMTFSFLKDPYFVDEIYLKKPTRVNVLAYLFLFALLVYKVFQRRIRQHVTEETPLMGAAKRKLVQPTVKLFSSCSPMSKSLC